MTTEVRVTIAGDVQRLALQPGDKLLFTTSDRLTPEDANVVTRELERLFPGHEAVIISGPANLKVMS